jgi:hypothetical protein
MAQRAFLILGMHRSGTSALARVISICGASLPRHSLDDHYEPAPIVELHDEWLENLGYRWRDYEWPSEEQALVLRDKLVQLVRDEYGDDPFLVIKDPRICRLVPLWLSVLKELSIEPTFILMVRHPVEVAHSLQVRDRLSIRRGVGLWLRYTIEMETATRALPRRFVSYAGLLADWRAEVAKLELPLMASTEAVDAYLSNSLRHHSDLSSGSFINARAVWNAITGHQGVIDHETIDKVRERLALRDRLVAPFRAAYRARRHRKWKAKQMRRSGSPVVASF